MSNIQEIKFELAKCIIQYRDVTGEAYDQTQFKHEVNDIVGLQTENLKQIQDDIVASLKKKNEAMAILQSITEGINKVKEKGAEFEGLPEPSNDMNTLIINESINEAKDIVRKHLEGKKVEKEEIEANLAKAESAYNFILDKLNKLKSEFKEIKQVSLEGSLAEHIEPLFYFEDKTIEFKFMIAFDNNLDDFMYEIAIKPSLVKKVYKATTSKVNATFLHHNIGNVETTQLNEGIKVLKLVSLDIQPYLKKIESFSEYREEYMNKKSNYLAEQASLKQIGDIIEAEESLVNEWKI